MRRQTAKFFVKLRYFNGSQKYLNVKIFNSHPSNASGSIVSGVRLAVNFSGIDFFANFVEVYRPEFAKSVAKALPITSK